MNRETLLEELNRLLDAGEPLLAVFPEQRPGDSMLQLPDNISNSMRLYANEVAWRATDRERYQRHWHMDTLTSLLKQMLRDCEAGLSGWRAIGTLR